VKRTANIVKIFSDNSDNRDKYLSCVGVVSKRALSIGIAFSLIERLSQNIPGSESSSRMARKWAALKY